MSSILDRYGIKEVADVTFYELGASGKPTNPVLFLDTLKVSNIEQTAESTDAKGGKGNAPLVTWDFGKEITVTLEDALFSIKSMAMMFGNGEVRTIKSAAGTGIGSGQQVIMKTDRFVAHKNVANVTTSNALTDSGFNEKLEGPDGKLYNKINPKFYNEEGTSVTALTQDNTYFCTYDVVVSGNVVEISANTFPGVYYITGDTYARSETTGKDEFFQFIIPKGKIVGENTLTLEAEGDPTVFSMNVKVLRPVDGKMMKLVKYTLAGEGTTNVDATSPVIHNHELTGNNSVVTYLNAGTTATTNTVEGLVTTDQVVYDKDVLSAASVSAADTLSLTAASGASNGDICTVTVFDKDGKFKATYTAQVTSG